MNTARLQPRLAATVSFSPRLQHAVRLLQMSTLDYAQALRDAALDNPFLDVEMSDGPAGADEAAAPAPASADSGIDVDFEAAHRFDRLPGLDPVASRHLSHDASQDLLQQAPVRMSLAAHLRGQLCTRRSARSSPASAPAAPSSRPAARSASETRR